MPGADQAQDSPQRSSGPITQQPAYSFTDSNCWIMTVTLMSKINIKPPPFRAEHVGSLKRPDLLQEARLRLLGPHSSDSNLGPHRNEELRALEDNAIRATVQLQEQIGLGDFQYIDHRALERKCPRGL
jgi:hypothetical protein